MKKTIMQRVNEWRKKNPGKSAAEACDALKVARSSYYSAKSSAKKKRKTNAKAAATRKPPKKPGPGHQLLADALAAPALSPPTGTPDAVMACLVFGDPEKVAAVIRQARGDL